MELVINRAKWRCGGEDDCESQRGIGITLLLNPEGYMCCLGQIACKVGAKKSDIIQHARPDTVDKYLPILVKDNPMTLTNLSVQAMEINDDINLTDEEREQKLKSLFSKYKHKLTFKGLYRDSKGKVIK